MSENDIREERLRKLARLREAGMDPYPPRGDASATIADLLVEFEGRAEREERATIAGRVMAKRGQGGIAFLDLFDGSAKMQSVLQKDDMPESFDLFTETVDIGDFIEVTGTAYVTKRGEKSIKASGWRMLSKSLMPIPDSWYGLKDEEKILRERYLDILLNDDVREMFVRRSKFWNSIRRFLLDRGYIEVETPVLESSPGGAEARPFVTHHNALDIDVYLRISAGELWQKRLMVAGYRKVFEIGRIFRNEGQSREHAQDYTQLEFYEAFSDYRDGMQIIQELYRTLAKEVYGKYTFEINGHTVDLANEWEVIEYTAAIQERFGVNAISCTEDEAIAAAKEAGVNFSETPNKVRAIDGLWKLIRKGVTGPAFLVGVPIYMEPLAKRVPGSPEIVERFQVILAGSEMGKGFSELNDPVDQRARFEEQQKMRDAGDDEAQRLDEEYVRAMEYGMPPAFGFGLSERLFSFLENKTIHEAQIFPLLRPRSE